MQFMKIRLRTAFANTVDPYIPEWWAQETLAILYEKMTASKLVHRDFEDMFQQHGDIVNTRRPGEFIGVRKAKEDEITVQDATSTNVAVALDQHNHVTFAIKDVEASMSFKDLYEQYAEPAGKALARMVDRMVLGQYPQFLNSNAGHLLGMTSGTVKDDILGLRLALDNTKCYEDGRNLVLNPYTESVCLKPEWFTSADKVGDSGTALRNASIGRKFDLDFYKDLNMGQVLERNTKRDGAINLTAGYAAGTTGALVVDGFTGTIGVNTWVRIGGIPYYVTASTATLGNATGITLDRALQEGVADNAVVSAYTPGAINFGAGYAAGWNKTLTIDGFTIAPQIGQMVTFGVGASPAKYTIIDVTGTTSILLDRSLEAALLDDATVNIGPAGYYNFAFHRNALTLAIRPLAPVPAGAGARSATVSMNGLTMRATIAYEARKQQTLWTLDFLAGIKTLDTNLGAVLFA